MTHDLIRIVLSDDAFSGYLYAYPSTWIGKTLLTKDQYGMTVAHIEPPHVKSIPVPKLPSDIQKKDP